MAILRKCLAGLLSFNFIKIHPSYLRAAIKYRTVQTASGRDSRRIANPRRYYSLHADPRAIVHLPLLLARSHSRSLTLTLSFRLSFQTAVHPGLWYRPLTRSCNCNMIGRRYVCTDDISITRSNWCRSDYAIRLVLATTFCRLKLCIRTRLTWWTYIVRDYILGHRAEIIRDTWYWFIDLLTFPL